MEKPNSIKETIPEEKAEKEPKLDALVVMGAVMKWDEKRGEWSFPSIIENYSGAIVMGKARAKAALELEKNADQLLVTGGVDTNPLTGNYDSRSQELTKLIKKLGVDSDKVIPMGKGGNTLANVRDLAEYLEKNPDVLKENRIGVLCLSYQYERARAMFDSEYAKNSFFQKHKPEVRWYQVEEVLKGISPRHNRHYGRWARQVAEAEVTVVDPKTGEKKSGKAGDIASEMERRGLEDFEKGQYNPATK